MIEILGVQVLRIEVAGGQGVKIRKIFEFGIFIESVVEEDVLVDELVEFLGTVKDEFLLEQSLDRFEGGEQLI